MEKKKYGCRTPMDDLWGKWFSGDYESMDRYAYTVQYNKHGSPIGFVFHDWPDDGVLTCRK